MTHKLRRVPTASTAFAVRAAELPIAPPDSLIDRALHSLRAAHPPSGLEQRVAARLTQAADAHIITSSSRASSRSSVAETSNRASFFAIIPTLRLPKGKHPRILFNPAPLSIVAATALLAISLLAVNDHHKPTTAHSDPQVPQGLSAASAHALQAVRPANTQELQGLSPNTLVPQAFRPANTLVPQGFSLGSHSASKKAGVLTPASTDLDPNTLALAETQAPSHPAPTMPLTAQEHLLLTATRQGQPIELAALDTLRQPALQAAAEARQRERIRRYAQSLLGPLAAAEALNSTSPPLPDEVSTALPPSSK